MRAVFVILLFLILQVQTYAQIVPWVKSENLNIQFNPELTYFPTDADRFGNSFTARLALFKLSFGQDYYGDVAVRKFSDSGVERASKVLTGKTNIAGLSVDNSGCLYAAGSFMDSLIIDPSNVMLNTGTGFNLNYFIIKFDSMLNVVWKKNLNITQPSVSRLRMIRATGNSLLTTVQSGTASYAKKYDLSGNELLSIQLSGSALAGSVVIDKSECITVSGACGMGNLTFGNLNVYAPFSYNMYFAKFNSAGNCLWVNFVRDITFQEIDLNVDANDNIYAAGDLYDSTSFGNIQAQGRQWVFDFFLTKISPTGVFQWVREVPNHTGQITGDARRAKGNSIAVSPENEVYLAGILRGTVNWGNNFTSVTAGSNDALLLKYDTNGGLLNVKNYGGNSNERFDDITLDMNGNLYCSGNHTFSSQFDTISISSTGSVNSFLLKIPFGRDQGTVLLSMIMEGFYDATIKELASNDTAELLLRSAVAPYEIVETSSSVINKTDFTASFRFLKAASGNYYISVRHRNSVETWSSQQVQFAMGGTSQFSFIHAKSAAYGSNMVQVDNNPQRFAVYSGDVNQDGVVDAFDASETDNDAFMGLSGYYPTDVNGDNFVDGSDALIVDNNVMNFIQVISP